MCKLYDFRLGELLLVDKPIGWTSFDVVNKLRYPISSKTGIKRIKVGHAGTLDPLATGLLVICSGKATKSITSYMDLPKVYTGTFVLGANRPSYDMETPISSQFDISDLVEKDILSCAANFRGTLMQVPPLFSAKKVSGKRAYKLAREGSDILLPPNEITVYSFEVTRIALPEVDFEIRCSRGTYIRSIAHDFGVELGVGAYLKTLRRTAIGELSISDAHSVSHWINEINSSYIL